MPLKVPEMGVKLIITSGAATGYLTKVKSQFY